MSVRRAILLAMFASLVLLGSTAGPISVARADAQAPISEASKHFQRGVQLYAEADYHAALVEFRRAYEIAPNPTVLYNIGQTYYQLQNYAAALVALGRYLNEAGPSAAHRREVEQTVDTLQARVGKVAVTSNTPGLDITVDDELIGKTPLDEPILVSVGRRKITALRDGRPVENRYVDVAAGDTVKLAISSGAADIPASGPTPGIGGTTTTPSVPTKSSTVGWWITGGLGAVWLITAGAAYVESRSLADERAKVGAKRGDLDSKASLVSALSLTADISGVLAIVAGAFTIKISLSESSSHETHVSIAPNGIQFAGKF
jgi:hypothetical protein